MNDPYESRWRFLYGSAHPRWTLHAPDLCDLQWTVYDGHGKRTYTKGDTADEAVDRAIERDATERLAAFPPLQPSLF